MASPSVCFVRDNFGAQVLAMLFHWARGQQGAGPGAVQRLVKALVDSGRRDLAEEVQDVVTLGKRKYEESLKRVGLETPATSADPQSSWHTHTHTIVLGADDKNMTNSSSGDNNDTHGHTVSLLTGLRSAVFLNDVSRTQCPALFIVRHNVALNGPYPCYRFKKQSKTCMHVGESHVASQKGSYFTSKSIKNEWN